MEGQKAVTVRPATWQPESFAMLSSLRAQILCAGGALLLLLACNLASGPGTASSPTAASPSSVQSGIPVSATPIRFNIPEGLAAGATAETIDVVTDQTGAPWDVAPAHLQLTLQGYALGSSFHVPQLFVYPAQQYAGMNPAAAESLKRLQAVLANPGGSFTQETLPRVPFFNAGQVLAAQQKVLHFTGGAGVRFVTQYGQDVSPINNGGLFYHFEGLSDDGKYYIIAVLPVSLPFVAADSNPGAAVPNGGVPFPSNSASGLDYANYYKKVAALIDAAPPDQFSPRLIMLDDLAQSITVDQ